MDVYEVIDTTEIDQIEIDTHQVPQDILVKDITRAHESQNALAFVRYPKFWVVEMQ